ncbi:hypothetical protein [Glycomyces albidus]|uniref:Uncharacterized protein n=1 Tax=Glycomyces albidus TaxID=2656774 RepID=A0A6L5GB27_9ACTN|nr:hypothetical protein [Glycomyces albidus]MQM26796.1 hypothetical protein [Glycomyces albidus]
MGSTLAEADPATAQPAIGAHPDPARIATRSFERTTARREQHRAAVHVAVISNWLDDISHTA